MVLEGKATRGEILADLRTRVAALRGTGVTPGLGTDAVLERIDPSLEWIDQSEDADGLREVSRVDIVVAEVAGYLTPVPDGVGLIARAGPIARATLLANVVEATARAGSP
jgi:5,10-methylene-tetrahydrofolate dehydrogenase/methenyl tetrahydrofolate cyclohydrolase